MSEANASLSLINSTTNKRPFSCSQLQSGNAVYKYTSMSRDSRSLQSICVGCQKEQTEDLHPRCQLMLLTKLTRYVFIALVCFYLFSTPVVCSSATKGTRSAAQWKHGTRHVCIGHAARLSTILTKCKQNINKRWMDTVALFAAMLERFVPTMQSTICFSSVFPHIIQFVMYTIICIPTVLHAYAD